MILILFFTSSPAPYGQLANGEWFFRSSAAVSSIERQSSFASSSYWLMLFSPGYQYVVHFKSVCTYAQAVKSSPIGRTILDTPSP